MTMADFKHLEDVLVRDVLAQVGLTVEEAFPQGTDSDIIERQAASSALLKRLRRDGRAALDAEISKHAACSRIRVKNPMPDVWTVAGRRVPARWAQALEQDQQIAACCRHPENHTISAWYTKPEERAKGEPDIYVFHCDCGAVFRRICVGGLPTLPDGTVDYVALAKTGKEELDGQRPVWEAR